MSSVKLYEDIEKKTAVKRISVMCMFRNNSQYLKTFFVETMNQMEQLYDVEFDYYIIENNSTDNTRELLKEFIKTKSNRSKLLLFDLKQDFRNIGDGKNFERLFNLGRIRNKLVNSVTPLESQWCLFIDSNIFFKKEILLQMFEHCQEDIGMMTPYTQQLFIPEIHGKYIRNLEKPTLYNHYYDTFSYFDKNKKTFWPYCGFEKCSYCVRRDCNYREIVPKDLDVVDVTACFGGFALIRTEIINDDRIRWDTMSHEIQKDESVCEHFLFCYMLKGITKKRVVICQHVNDIYRTF
jgi:glycosyltransferase involved in cell wall biosynthesis